MKLSALLLLACWQIAAQTPSVVFESGNFKGLRNEQGETLIPSVYDDLGWSNGSTESEGQFIGYNEGGKWGLINLSNKRITEPRFDKIERFTSGRFRVAVKGKFTNRFFYGLMDEKGKIILNLDYFDLIEEQGAILVTIYEANDFMMGALKPNLSFSMNPNYQEIAVFENLLIGRKKNNLIDVYEKSGRLLEADLHSVREDQEFLITTRDGRDGLISGYGKIVHPTIHKEIRSFNRITSFPTWEVKIGTGQQFEMACDSIDYLGSDLWIIHANSSSQFFSTSIETPLGSFHLKQTLDGFVVVQSITSGEWMGLNSKGELIVSASDSLHFNGKYFYAQNASNWAVFSKAGEPLSDKNFDGIRSTNERYQAVKKFNYWAVLDCIDRTLTDFRYDAIDSIVGSKIVARYVGKWGVFQMGRGWIIQPTFDKITFANDHFMGIKGRGYYLMNANGQLLFNTIDKIEASEGHFILTFEGKYSALNEAGRPVANTEYREVKKWKNFYELNSQFVDLVSSSGQKILGQDDQVQNILAFSEGLFLIKKNNNFGFIDTRGNLRIANRYDLAESFSEGLAAVKLRGKWGFIDKSENLVIQPHYQSVSSFNNGLAIFKSNDFYGLLDTNGREVLSANYLSISLNSFGNYVMKAKNQTVEMANSKGITFLSGAYERIVDMGDSKVIGTLSGKQGVLSYSGQTIVNFDYEEIKIGKSYLILRK